MSTPSSRLPIVYVRGYASGTPGIEKAVTDPFYGFNEGSTHIRVGRQDSPVFYQFESPLVRLLTDEGYRVFVEGGQEAYLANHPKDIRPDSIWIHRFYDRCSGTWGGEPETFSLEHAAEDLLRLIEDLQERTGAPQVHLVAHSMGGLICRCLLQKVIPEQREGKRATDYVSKLFTYGTPHGGITFAVGFGVPEALRDTFALNGADIFGPDRMYQYLTPNPDPDGPPEGWRAVDMADDDGSGTPREAAGGFPLDRIFCMIGTDSDDYDVAHGLSASTVGPRSDGLVQIENAQVTGANRAFTHRSHSGRYGLVNSEEGYQNLRRFLFGDLRARVDLVDVTLPDRDPDVTWQAEVRLQVRGLPVLLHERAAPHWCPIQLSDPTSATRQARAAKDGAVQLATTFLSSKLLPRREDAERAAVDAAANAEAGAARPGASEPVRFALDLRVFGLKEHNGFFGFGDHLEQTADFADTLIVDVDTDSPRPAAWAHWNSEVDGAIRDLHPTGPPLPDEDPRAEGWLAHIPLPATTRPILGPDARIRLTVGPWS
ncbi:alpha/beta hydrolase [Kitasatospora purpeofusca]|uniref:alpha/beta fold hydrolase n=1 Tax=Kitasatospora purpeofusca TaxID=67352 RepID=UPI002257C425|nr:alpha/beta fold hydrolase [Kitasatospora purpeofusca]MCX4683590.1 alpha/beta hydrolase [Kitasatospora purpeofusca]